MPTLGLHFENAAAVGGNGFGPDPEHVQILLPEPPPGMVRVPLWASIQADGGAKMPHWVTCHGRMERTANALDPLWPSGTDTTLLLWSAQLFQNVIKGGEFFLPVPVYPIVRGTVIKASWSYHSDTTWVRTRSHFVDVPVASFDWSRVQYPTGLQLRQSSV